MEVFKNFHCPEEKLERSKPNNLSPTDEHLFESEFKRNVPKVSSAILRGGYITPNGMLINSNLLISNIQFNTGYSKRSLLKAQIKSTLSLRKIRNITFLKNSVFITNVNSKNFFHWFLDVLQKLEALESEKANLKDQGILILIPWGHDTDFIRTSLEAYGLNLYRQREGELIVLKNLAAIPDIAPPTGNYRQHIVRSLQSRLRSYWKGQHQVGAGQKKRLYITRKNSLKRRLINEEEIYPILESHDISIVDFDGLQFHQQLRLALESEMLVSLHGAGLTHMLWMMERSKILEIRARDDSSNNCYYTLASDLGHQYYYVLADKVSHQRPVQNSDFTLNPKSFAKGVQEMLR